MGSIYVDTVKLNGGWSPTPAYLKCTYRESIPVHSSPVDATKRRVEVLGFARFTELLCDRKNWNGGLLIHMSQVRVLPGEPVFSMIFYHSHRYCNDVNISLVEIWSSTFSAVKRSSGGNFRPAGSM